MDYAPNIAAVTRATQRLMPAILARHPQASFHIVGRAPTPAVQALHGVNGTQVHGAVPDMRPFLAAADIALVPLEIARGVQNKVLEAMAMALPCVLSPGAATGIEARDGTDYSIAESDEALIETHWRCWTIRSALGPWGRRPVPMFWPMPAGMPLWRL
jgi:glycosyltransferase involved in cell wall biosynthesis